MSNVVMAFVALLIVLVLIVAVAWLVRRFSSGASGANASRGRMPRLAVIDAAAVDGRRRLVLVRRDNVEHLIMIGGPTDVVVEANIARATQPREQAPQRGPAGTELPARLSPLPDAHWQENESLDHHEPALPEPSRAGRRASPSIADWNANEFSSGLTPEPAPRGEARALPRSERTEPAMTPRMPRASDIPAKAPPLPPRAPSRPAEPTRQAEPQLSSADQNLAEMAQRLEAALRRPGSEPRPAANGGEAKAPAVSPADRVGAPLQARPAPAPAARPQPDAKPPAFDNLEDEMASLLGRPKPPA